MSGLNPTLFIKMNYFKSLEEKIREYLAPIIKFEGYELIELKLIPLRGKLLLKLLINKRGGITMAECVDMNGKISKILDEVDFINQSYILEVSSPGLNRVLKEEKEFKCVIGRDLIVKMKNGHEFKGNLLDVKPDKIIITCQDKVLDIFISDIDKARQIINLSEADNR